MAPRTWVIVGDKRGDNGQVDTIVEGLGWPVEYKRLCMQPQWVLGKPRYRATLAHLDRARSDPLQPPWPDLIITVGRRPSMAALWVRRQSGGRTKVVLVGKPSGYMLDFSLVVASAENQMPPMHNFQATTLPFMRVDPAAVAAEAERWRARLAPLPKPLIAILVGGQTNPFIMNRKVARDLVATARWVRDELGGTPYITTSRRTTPEVVAVLKEELGEDSLEGLREGSWENLREGSWEESQQSSQEESQDGSQKESPNRARLFEWAADAPDNPYKALLGTADGFIVTGDSVSMMVEVIRLGKPLAIFPLPGGVLGGVDQLRRSLAHWLFNPRQEGRLDRLRHSVARGVYYLDVFKLLCATRDFRAFHRLLVDRRLAVWAGQPFRPAAAELPDDLDVVLGRIRALFPDS